MLQVKPCSAQAENRPAPAEVIKGHRSFGHYPRVPERVRTNQETELDARRDFRPRRKGGPPFEDRLMWIAEDRVQVIPGPEVLVAELLHAFR